MNEKPHTSPNAGWNDKLYRENYDKIFNVPEKLPKNVTQIMDSALNNKPIKRFKLL